MNRWLQFLCVTMLLGSMAGVAGADERILAFDSVIRIAADGSLDVTETITVRAEGSQIRRGIYRDFPTRYRDAHGFRHSVDFEMVSLRRDDITEPWFTETLGNGVRINFGNDNFLPVPGEFRYELRYRTRRQLGYFESHDELYWNVTGNDWDFVIDRASARVELPQPIAPASLRLDAYTGPTGSRENWTRVEAAAGVATWTLRGSLDPGSGMTVVLGFPKGLVPEPSAGVRLGWWLRDFTGPIASFGILFAMLAFYYRLWNRIGRDPAAGTIIVRYDPPREHSPAGLRYLKRYAYDPVCFSADAVALAVAGTLRIEHEKGGFLGKDAWSLHSREAPVPDEVPLGDSRRSLMATLFSGTRRVVELEASNRSHLMAARAAHEAGLKRKYEPRYFKNNSGWVVVGILGSIVGAGLGVVLSRGNEASILLSLLGGALMLVTSIVFAFLLRRPTEEGRKVLDYIEGLRRYLSVAERDELARLASPEPQLDAARYQQLLPYALALDVEAAWTRHFTATVGQVAAAEAARSAGWVAGSGFAGNSFTDMGSSLGRSFSSQIASSSAPPGSSSGGGGGGSSGGGGGGGGGGGR